MIVLTDVLIVVVALAYIAVVFAVVYFVGEKTFWGGSYLRQGYRILLSRRFDAYLFTAGVLDFAIPLVVLCVQDKSLLPINALTKWGLFVFFVVMLLCSWLLGKVCIFYNDDGLLLSKPFKRHRFVPWDEIGNIQKKNTSAQLYNVFDKNGRRLIWFPLSKKTQAFFELAQQHGIDVHIPKDTKMVYSTSNKKLNGTLGEWDAVLDRSAYAQNDIIAFALFQDFMVALFMDRRLNEDNVIAINRDGTVRWKISDIIKQSGHISYAALTQDDEHTISVMAVMSRQYDCTIYEIDVCEQKIIHQHSRRDI